MRCVASKLCITRTPFACSAHSSAICRCHQLRVELEQHVNCRHARLAERAREPADIGVVHRRRVVQQGVCDLSEHARRQGHYRSSDFRGRPRSTSCSRRDRCRERGHRCRDRLHRRVRGIARSWRRAGGRGGPRARSEIAGTLWHNPGGGRQVLQESPAWSVLDPLEAAAPRHSSGPARARHVRVTLCGPCNDGLRYISSVTQRCATYCPPSLTHTTTTTITTTVHVHARTLSHHARARGRWRGSGCRTSSAA